MKFKNLFHNIGLLLVLGLALGACTQEDEDAFGDKPYKIKNGLYIYPVQFECEAPGYDDAMTRATGSGWSKNTSLFARFKSGSTYYIGFLTLVNNIWQLVSTNDFLDMTTAGDLELYYFQESNGDYYYFNLDTQCFDIYNNGSFVRSTSIPWDNESFDLSEGTAVYSSTSGKYTYSPKHFTINATLKPVLWRMRFKGDNGTSISLPEKENDIKYCSTFNFSATTNPNFTTRTKNVSLTVSGGYTPYIYGEFASDAANKVTVQNGSDVFTRNFSATNLPAGKSGVFTLPTSANYSGAGWAKVVTEVPMALKDMLEKPMGNININMEIASYQLVRNEVAKTYTIEDLTTNDGVTWFRINAEKNDACNNMTYQGLPFALLTAFKSNNGFSVTYYFTVEKSKASYNYKSYLNKILQDFNNLNISLKENSLSTDLASYYGYNAYNNYVSVNVSDNNTKYEFRIYVSFNNNGVMTLEKMLVNPMTTVNINMKTSTYQAVRNEVAKSYKIKDHITDDGQPWYNLSVSDNTACSDMTYQGLPFESFASFRLDDGFNISYYFMIEKSKASYNYRSYLNKILQDYKNQNISLEENSSKYSLAVYRGYDTDKNYHSVDVDEYGTDKYRFCIYVAYYK